MLGNDVVDLRDAEARPRHERFDTRVFSEAERRALAAGPDALRWVLWAAKESAYKAARRLDPETVFAPRRFSVVLEDERSGRVEAAGRSFRFWVLRCGDCLHALALEVATPAEGLTWGIACLSDPEADPRTPGRAVRELAREALAPHLGLLPAELGVERRNRIPHLAGPDGAALPGALSLSHHGRFVAWAHHPGAKAGAAP